MSNFPINLDDDTTLPIVNDNITEIGAEAINALRDAVFAIEQNIGLGAAGSTGSLAERMGVSLDAAGAIKPSAIAGLGLVTLPITEDQIANTANIPESKLRLDHRTQDLFNYIRDLSGDVNFAKGWINTTGGKLEPHLAGVIFRHTLSQIDVATDPSLYLKNKFTQFRNNTNAYELIKDINNELLDHQTVDGSPTGIIQNITTKSGAHYPSNYAHTASAIFINTSRFATIPQTAQDLQLLVEFIDSASIFLLGTRIQNLYTDGISRVSRSSSLTVDGYGSPVVPPTPAIAYLRGTGLSSSPVDDIDIGDDIIELKPSTADMASNSFDTQFARVKVGDIIRINYGTVEVQFVIKEKKYNQSGGNKKYVVRIARNNLLYTTNASARIDRPLINNNKSGVLAVAAANNSFLGQPSLIVGSPRGAQALGVGFEADLLDNSHYLLYLALYPTGSLDGYTILPAIDVTGNQGATPGKYTLESVVEATNNAFRQNGFNYRFIAYSYQGEFGVMLADSYNNAGFSILSAVVKTDGSLDELGTNTAFPNNVVGMFSVAPATPPDPLGLGPSGSNVASPPFMTSYGSPEAALNPTKLFLPLKRNNYYVDGVEKEKLNIEEFQSLDGYGDGYWIGTITNRSVFPGAPPIGRVQTTYRIALDLSATNLKVGKTIVIQSYGEGGLVDYGRFTIQSINSSCPPNPFTDLTVYDAVHATGLSPTSSLNVGGKVAIYFNSDSVSFNAESATDLSPTAPFKRYFEVYIDKDANTFTHERARFSIGGSLTVNGVPLYTTANTDKFNLVKVSPKLRGYQFGSVNKITLHIISSDATTNTYTAQLTRCDTLAFTFTNLGPLTTGKFGEVVRFYDETNVDYVDVIYELEDATSYSDDILEIQLFPTLSLDSEEMLIATCQLNDTLKNVKYLRDARQFGNTSEKDLSTSALDLISLPEKLLHANGIVRGFDLVAPGTNPSDSQIFIMGGVALVNGKIIQMNNETVNIPIIKESYFSTLFNFRWAVCVNDKGEYQPIPLLDVDTSISGIPTSSRPFIAYNPATSTTYEIDAVTFTDLVEKRKDLTILYLVTSLVNQSVIPATIALTISDARKYVSDGESNAPIVLTSDNVQGNFKTLDSVLNWINFNTSFNTHVLVRGTHDINFQHTFDFRKLNRQIIFEGDGGTFNVNFDQGILLGSFVTFRNLKFNYNYASSPVDLVDSTAGMIYSSIGNDTIVSNITIEDCIFNVTNASGNKYSYICIVLTSVGAVLKDVFIRRNKFKTKLVTEYHAAISIVSSASDTNGVSPLLSNVIISDNILDSEQSIVVTSDITNNANLPGLSCINTRIVGNICGGIGILTTSANGSGPGTGPELNGMLTIENNTCKYIYNANIDGKFVELFIIPTTINNIIADTGNTVIQNNKCAFIHCGVRATDLNNTMLRISGNILTSNIAVGTAHTSDYLNNFGYPSASIRYAIYVSSRTISGSLSNSTIISDNIVMGNTSLGFLTTGYESYIRMGSSGTIVNNKLQGILPAATSSYEYSGIIYDGYGSSVISHNNIMRSISDIYAYVTTRVDLSGLNTANYAQVIENIFDTTTVNGTDELVGKDVAGNDLSIYWMFERNKNQIKSVLISLSDGQSTLNTSPGIPPSVPPDALDFGGGEGTIAPIFSTPTGSQENIVGAIFDSTYPIFGPNLIIGDSGLDFKNYTKLFSIDTRLPSGVTIISCKVGIRLLSSLLSTSPVSKFNLVLTSSKKYDDNFDFLSSFAGIQTSTAAQLAVTGVDGPGTVSNTTLFSGTTFIEILPTVGDPYRTGSNYNLGLLFSTYYAQDPAVATSLGIIISPIKIKFRW